MLFQLFLLFLFLLLYYFIPFIIIFSLYCELVTYRLRCLLSRKKKTHNHLCDIQQKFVVNLVFEEMIGNKKNQGASVKHFVWHGGAAGGLNDTKMGPQNCKHVDREPPPPWYLRGFTVENWIRKFFFIIGRSQKNEQRNKSAMDFLRGKLHPRIPPLSTPVIELQQQDVIVLNDV